MGGRLRQTPPHAGGRAFPGGAAVPQAEGRKRWGRGAGGLVPRTLNPEKVGALGETGPERPPEPPPHGLGPP